MSTTINSIEILKIFFPMLTAFVGAYLGYLLAIRKTKEELIWNKKQDAYHNIINSLHNLSIVFKNLCESNNPMSVFNPEETDKSISHHIYEIEKQIILNSILISHKVTDEFHILTSTIHEELMELEHDGRLAISEACNDSLQCNLIKLDSYSNILTAINNTIDKIRSIGKNELKI